MKTTKEIVEETYSRVNSKGILFIEDGEAKWFSESEVEKLQKELHDTMEILDSTAYNEWQIRRSNVMKRIDSVFNNFKGK